MRKRINSPFIIGALTLLAVFSGNSMGELKDVTKPYLGVYECTEARLSSHDFLTRFEKMDLELKADETFTLYYCEQGGKPQKQTGRYVYDREKESITLIGGGIKREFPFKQGILVLSISIGKETLTLKFEQKS